MQTQGLKRILLVAQRLSRGFSPAPQTLPCEAGLRGCEGRPPLQLPPHRPCLRWETRRLHAGQLDPPGFILGRVSLEPTINPAAGVNSHCLCIPRTSPVSPSELPAPAGSAPSSERGPELGLQQQKPTIRSPGAEPCLDGQRLGDLRTVALRV